MVKKYRIMRRFRINEISLVDVPAQTPAAAAITKAFAKRGGALGVKKGTEPAQKVEPEKSKPKMTDLAGTAFSELTDEEREFLTLSGVDPDNITEHVNEDGTIEIIESDEEVKVKDITAVTTRTFKQLAKSHGDKNAALITMRKANEDTLLKQSSFMAKVDEIHSAALRDHQLAKSKAGLRGRTPSAPKRTDAMAKARMLHPELFALHQRVPGQR